MEIKGVGGQQPSINKNTGTAPEAPSEEVSFEQMMQETQQVSYASSTDVKNPLGKISTNLIPMQESKRDIVGYQTTFLGTFSKNTQANLNRTDNLITINSPLGNMKLEKSNENPGMIYVEMPQGNFTGNVSVGENGDITIESHDKKKAIFIQSESNGDVKVTNKGIQENVKLVFKGLSS